MKAAMPTNAVSIPIRDMVPRMLLSRSLVSGHMDLLGVRVRHESEVRVRERRVERPRQAGNEGRLGRIIAVNDHQLLREGLVTLLDPDFPVRILFAEGVVVGRNP